MRECLINLMRRGAVSFLVALFCMVIVGVVVAQSSTSAEEQKIAIFIASYWKAIVEIVLLTGAAVALYYRMENRIAHFDDSFLTFKRNAESHWGAQETSMNRLTSQLNDHMNSETPHGICKEHKQALIDVAGQLERIHDDLNALRSDISSYRNAVLLVATRTNLPNPSNPVTIVEGKPGL